MKYFKLLILLLLCLPSCTYAGSNDSINEVPLKYDELPKNANRDDYLWIAGDRKFNVYYKDSNFIVENKMKKWMWLIHGHSFASYPNSEIYVDTAYFQNISESNQKELVVGYSQFNLRPGINTKSKHLLVVDLTERKIILNVATYDFRIGKDENGKVTDYLYEAEVEISHNFIRVTSTDDSDIDNPAIQLDDGIYRRHGHCFVRH